MSWPCYPRTADNAAEKAKDAAQDARADFRAGRPETNPHPPGTIAYFAYAQAYLTAGAVEKKIKELRGNGRLADQGHGT